MGDHTEAIQLDFDPSVISFEKLCHAVWAAHNPCARKFSRQYDSILFYANDEQKKTVAATYERVEQERGKVTTRVEKLDKFYHAEDYHQKYYLRGNKELFSELRKFYATEEDFMHSPAAARLNSYLSGSAKREQIEKDLGKLGLSDEARKKVLVCAR